MHEITVAHYQAVRDEVLARMGMRENILTVYLGFVGVVFGLAVAENPLASVALVVPFIAFGVAWIFRDHELALAHLGQWLIEDYTSHIERAFPESPPPHWDNSQARMLYGKKVLVSRYMTYGLVSIGSSVAAIIIAWTPVIEALLTNECTNECISFGMITITILGSMVALIFTIGTLVMTILTWLQRKNATGSAQN